MAISIDVLQKVLALSTLAYYINSNGSAVLPGKQESNMNNAINVVSVNGQAIDFDAAVNLMDDDIREDLNNRIGGCTEQEFFDAYLSAHQAKYGEEFVVA